VKSSQDCGNRFYYKNDDYPSSLPPSYLLSPSPTTLPTEKEEKDEEEENKIDVLEPTDKHNVIH
jgi:hypothetical protein